MSEILPCPNCESESEYVGGSNSNVDTIFCSKCPLEVSQNEMSYKELLSIWNSLPRRGKKRKEKILKSSNIYSIEWDENNLTVHYNNGTSYKYKEISESVFIEMSEAESAGSFLHQNIKGKYRYEQI